MAYVKKTLAAGEDYLYRAHFNWTYDAQSLFWLALGSVPAGLWLYGAARDYFRHDPFGQGFLFFGGAGFALGFIICLSRYVHKWTTVIAVTSLRLVYKEGLIARTSHELMLDEIEEIFMRQTFLGRILGFGVITVRGTGDVVIEFPVLGAPVRVRREIEAAVARARAGEKGASTA